MTSTENKAGLEGVVAGRSAVSDLDPAVDKLYYRGYDIHELAERSSFEETAFLLLKGELPRAGELKVFQQSLRRSRAVPPAVFKSLAALPDRKSVV